MMRTLGGIGHTGPADASHSDTASKLVPHHGFYKYSSFDLGCPITTDHRLVCWPSLVDDGTCCQTYPQYPPGQYIADYAGPDCAIRLDHMPVCVSAPGEGPPVSPPDGKLLALALDDYEICGLTMTRSIVCRTDKGYDPRWGEPPPGPFRSLIQGVSCAIRRDFRMVCWGPTGPNGRATPLPGRVTQVIDDSSFDLHGPLCGLRPNRRMFCTGGVPAASGQFLQLRGTPSFWCALRLTHYVVCGGYVYRPSDPTPSPHGRFASLGLIVPSLSPEEAGTACGIRLSGYLACWGPGATPIQSMQPGVPWAEESFLCGVRVDGSLGCPYGDSTYGNPPQFRFRQISGDCGITIAGSLRCWPPLWIYGLGVFGEGELPQRLANLKDPVSGRVTAIAGEFWNVGDDALCAVRSRTGGLRCWGDIHHPPSGSFRALSIGYASDTVYQRRDFACAIRTTSHIQCWGNPRNLRGQVNGQVDPPKMAGFIQVSAGFEEACGLLNSGRAVCWGSMSRWLPGVFKQVAVEGQESLPSSACGLRYSGQVTCFGVHPPYLFPSGGRYTYHFRGRHWVSLSQDNSGCGITAHGYIWCPNGLYVDSDGRGYLLPAAIPPSRTPIACPATPTRQVSPPSARVRRCVGHG